LYEIETKYVSRKKKKTSLMKYSLASATESMKNGGTTNTITNNSESGKSKT